MLLAGLQRMADAFYEIKVIPKKIDVSDPKYNCVYDKQS
jgi:sulfonate transport system substrate-binding protein